MIRYGGILSCLVAVSLCAGCGGAEEEPVPTPMPEDVYAEIMAEFSRIRRRPPQVRTQVERDRVSDSLRTEILEDHGVTAEDMLAFAEIVGSDPVRMQRITERIAALSDSMDAELRRDTPVDPTDTVTRADSAAGPDSGGTDEAPAPRFADPRPGPPADSAQEVESAPASDTGAATPPPSDSSVDSSGTRIPREFRPSRRPRPRQ